jgi:hypothetical protein
VFADVLIQRSRMNSIVNVMHSVELPESRKCNSHVRIAMFLMMLEDLAVHDIFKVVGMRFEPARPTA